MLKVVSCNSVCKVCRDAICVRPFITGALSSARNKVGIMMMIMVMRMIRIARMVGMVGMVKDGREDVVGGADDSEDGPSDYSSQGR